MRLIRIYVPQPLILEQITHLDEAASHHLINVLRISVGAEIAIFNGNGAEYLAEVVAINKKNVSARLLKKIETFCESSLAIELVQGISRGERMDVVIQKSVELGVTEITPIFTARCEVKLVGDRLERRIEHWQKIIIGACEQSGRVRLPILNRPVAFNKWNSAKENSLKLICVPAGATTLAELPKNISRVSLLIGPEGGLTDDEVIRAKEDGYIPFRMGPRILRTETAAIVALSLLQAKWGDIN